MATGSTCERGVRSHAEPSGPYQPDYRSYVPLASVPSDSSLERLFGQSREYRPTVGEILIQKLTDPIDALAPSILKLLSRYQEFMDDLRTRVT